VAVAAKLDPREPRVTLLRKAVRRPAA